MRRTGRWAAQAVDAAGLAREEAEAGIAEAREQALAEIEAFRASYPERLRFEYRLDRSASERPFQVEAMWHDGLFTYLRSHAQESPALYELQDGEPSLVAFDLTEDGLYIARRVPGRRMDPDRRQAAALAVRARGGSPMSRWKQWVKEPKGALPGGIVTKAGIALITVLVAGLLFSSTLSGPDETADGVAPTEQRPVDDRTGRSLDGRLDAETMRQSQQAAADADSERQQSDDAGRESAGQDAGGGCRQRRCSDRHWPGRVRASRGAPA